MKSGQNIATDPCLCQSASECGCQTNRFKLGFQSQGNPRADQRVRQLSGIGPFSQQDHRATFRLNYLGGSIQVPCTIGAHRNEHILALQQYWIHRTKHLCQRERLRHFSSLS